MDSNYLYYRLTRLLEREIKLHGRFLAVIKEQRELLTKFRVAPMEALDSRREHLAADIDQAHKERLGLLAQVEEARGKKLTEFVQEYFPAKEKIVLMPLIDELKEVVAETRVQSIEYQSITNFALNMVHGSISLLWQATQNVTRSYGRGGKLHESYSPTRSRHERVLKQA